MLTKHAKIEITHQLAHALNQTGCYLYLSTEPGTLSNFTNGVHNMLTHTCYALDISYNDVIDSARKERNDNGY